MYAVVRETTLWHTAEDMTAARGVMGPVVERTVNPLMTSPAKLLGTGPVVVDDLTHVQQGSG